MIIEIDIGNTRIKWRCLEYGVVQDRGVVESGERDGWANTIRDNYLPAMIRLACVGDRALVNWVDNLAQEWDCVVREAYTTRKIAGIRCGYDEPEDMGVDRWLAVVAAYHQFHQTCVVVDVGSAITVDIVDSYGQHIGGYIVPGFRMMRQSLYLGTNKVKVKLDDHDGIGPGKATAQAVSRGGLLMVKAMIEHAVKDLAVAGVTVPVVITGGDATHLVDVLVGEVYHVPELVLDGLAIVVP
ncbi:MAG: type III pantothenate kinase [Porticoccus sp.]